MRRGERGFTLLEVLVAFTIAALALGALYRGAIGGLGAAQVAGRTEEAVSRAQSRLAALTAGPLRPGDRQGDDGDGYRWHERVALLAEAQASPAQAGGPLPALYAVSVAVSWGKDGGGKDGGGKDGERTVRLDTKRIGFAQGATP